MTFDLALRPQAEAELEEAAGWYNEISSALGERFGRTVSHFSALGMRRCKLKKFPYNIHYLVEESSIVVISVFHTKRDQEPLRKRL